MVAGIARGDLRLTIDESCLSAALDFTPNPAGAEWNAEKLYKLALEHRISPIDKSRIDKLLLDFSHAQKGMSAILATGEAPIEPTPEEPAWEPLEVPEELHFLLDEAMLTAKPPAIYRVRVETVQVEKTVTKAGALPFLPGREEKVLGTEKREVRERVPLDFTVRRVGYARKGDKLAVLYAPKPGKAGKNVLGKAIPAPQDFDTAFYLGSGIQRVKADLIAESDGFVRIGSQWADLIPVTGHVWNVRRSDDRTGWVLDYTPGDRKLGHPSAAEILKAAKAQGADEASLIGEAELESIVKRAAEGGARLEAESISPDRDSAIEISVSEDRLRAALTLRKGRGKGRPLDLNAVARAISGYKLAGLNTEKLRKDLLEFWRGPAEELLDYELTRGRESTPGKQRTIAYAVVFLPPERAEPIVKSILAHPKASEAVPSLAESPLKAEDKITIVQAGQSIAELSPPTAGQPGQDVFGGAIPGAPGAMPPVKFLERVAFTGAHVEAEEGGILAITEAGGESLIRIIPRRDAAVEVKIAEDGLSASMTLQSEAGIGTPLTLELALAALEAKGVAHGVDRDAVAGAVAVAKESGFCPDTIVARGKPARAPSGTKVDYKIQLERKGTALTATVKAGDAILIATGIGNAAPPEDGIDVFGRTLSSERAESDALPPAKDASIKVERNPRGDVRYVAAISGELAIRPEGASIVAKREIPGNVDARTGHVSFAGSLRVTGAVASGMKVIGGGDVFIDGPVAASLVSSDGSVLLASGIRGQGKAIVRAKKSIMALFAEQASLMAVEDVKLKRACVRCNVKTNGRVLVIAEDGQLSGGDVRTKRGIDTAVLGSPDGQKTVVSFGQDFLVRDLIETEEREIAKIHERLIEIDRRMRQLESAKSSLDQVRAEKLSFMKLLEKYTLHVFNLREKSEEFFPSEIKVRVATHKGVVLECHNRFYEISSTRGPTVYAFDPEKGRIVERAP
jgi:hypothetical protein